GDCTLVNPTVVNLQTCVPGTINNQPYYSDCRWKTQNVRVHNNTFNFNPSHIGSSCTSSNACGLEGLFSNWGSYPDWSPYMEDVIQEAITFTQNNVFSNNSYVGPWQFMAHDQDTIIGPTEWRSSPYNQDAGSTFQ